MIVCRKGKKEGKKEKKKEDQERQPLVKYRNINLVSSTLILLGNQMNQIETIVFDEVLHIEGILN